MRIIAGPSLAAALFLAVLLVPGIGAAGTLGQDPFPGVRTVEEIPEILCFWFHEGLRDLPLVHLGARPVFHPGDAGDLWTGPGLREALESQSCEALRKRVSGHLRDNSLYMADDFALAASHLGVVRELWWVVPSRGRLPRDEIGPFKDWLRESFGLPERFIAGLNYDGAVIRGEYDGLPVRLCTLEDLPSLEGPVLFSLDSGYFQKLYENPVKGGMLDILGWFFAALREKRLQGAAAAVAYGEEAPLAFRYLGTRVREFLTDPAAFRQGPPEGWRQQQQYEYLSFMMARDDALRAADKLSSLEPDSPLPWYDRALVAAYRGEAEKAGDLLAQAETRDPAYRKGYVELSEILYTAGHREEALALVRRGGERHSRDLGIGIVLVKLLADRGHMKEAAETAFALSEAEPSVPLLHILRAHALRESGEETLAEEAMERFRETAPPGGWRDGILGEWNGAFPLP